MSDALHPTQILQQEYLRCCAEVERLLTQNEKVIQFGTLVSGGLLYGSLAKGSLPLHLLVPITLVGIFLYLVNVHEFAMIQRGYILHLEGRLNSMVEARLLVWETDFASRRTHYRETTNALVFLGATVCLIASGVSFYKSHEALQRDYPGCPWYEVALAIYALVFIALLALGVYQVTRLAKLRAEVAEDLNRLQPTGSPPMLAGGSPNESSE